MSDTPEPHEVPPRSIIGRALRGVTFYDKLCIGPSDADVLAGAVLGALTAAGYVVVKADGLQHGDELVRLGTTWSSLTGLSPRTESEGGTERHP